MKKIICTISVITLVLLFGSANSLFAQAPDVSGKWNMKVETSAGNGTPVFVLKQAGETITGTYTGQLGQADVKGTLKEKEIRLEFKAGEINVVYTGTVEGNTMKGKAVFGDMGEGTFSGTKETK
ncbi:MAG: hypothetical protein ACR2KZ_08890 [Segetibacter sp.]